MFYHVSLGKVGESDADEQVCQPCTVYSTKFVY